MGGFPHTTSLANNNGVSITNIGAAGAPTSAAQLGQLSPVGTITSGALPTVTAANLAAGTQLPNGGVGSRDADLYVPCTMTPTAGATATVTVALSADNVTYTTLYVLTVPVGVALDGFVLPAHVRVPAGWYVKMTPNAQAAVGTGTYA